MINTTGRTLSPFMNQKYLHYSDFFFSILTYKLKSLDKMALEKSQSK